MIKIVKTKNVIIKFYDFFYINLYQDFSINDFLEYFLFIQILCFFYEKSKGKSKTIYQFLTNKLKKNIFFIYYKNTF